MGKTSPICRADSPCCKSWWGHARWVRPRRPARSKNASAGPAWWRPPMRRCRIRRSGSKPSGGWPAPRPLPRGRTFCSSSTNSKTSQPSKITFGEFFSKRVVNGQNRVESGSSRVALTVGGLMRKFTRKKERNPLDSDPRLHS
jgi:hypothetical protein